MRHRLRGGGETAAGPAGADDRSYGKLFIAAAVLQFLQVVLRFCPYMEVVDGEFAFFYIDDGFFIWLEILMSIAAIGLTVLPVIRHTLRKRRRLALQKLVCLWFLGWAVILWGIVIAVHANVELEVEVLKLTVGTLRIGFWLPLPVGLALFVLLFVISHKSRRYQEKKPKKADMRGKTLLLMLVMAALLAGCGSAGAGNSEGDSSGCLIEKWEYNGVAITPEDTFQDIVGALAKDGSYTVNGSGAEILDGVIPVDDDLLNAEVNSDSLSLYPAAEYDKDEGSAGITFPLNIYLASEGEGTMGDAWLDRLFFIHGDFYVNGAKFSMGAPIEEVLECFDSAYSVVDEWDEYWAENGIEEEDEASESETDYKTYEYLVEVNSDRYILCTVVGIDGAFASMDWEFLDADAAREGYPEYF